MNVGSTQQMTATGKYSDGSTKDLTASVAWSSSNTAVATISSSGLLTGVAAGQVTVTAATSGVNGTAAASISQPLVSVNKQVVDSTNVGVGGLTVSITTASAPVQTDPAGNFMLSVSPGSQTLTIQMGTAAVLTAPVTVGADGSISQYPGAIQVTLPNSPYLPKFTFVERPQLTVTPSTPTSGQSVTVAYTDSSNTAQSVAVTFTGSGCGSLVNGTLSGTSYSQTSAAGNAGTCLINATVQFSSGAQQFNSQFVVEPSSVTLPALSIAGGSYIAGDSLPAQRNKTGNPTISTITAPGSLINGATERFTLSVSGIPTGAKLISIQVQLSGIPGYFSVPAQLDANGNYYFDLSLDQDYFATTPALESQGLWKARRDLRVNPALLTPHGRLGAAAQGGSNSLSLNLQLTDSQGNIGASFTQACSTHQVGAGALQISLSWDTLVDLDLHVVEPDGEEIYYANRTASDGGTLDLDSNAACSIDGVNNENVTWPSPATPSAGSYIVRADYWESCTGGGANYQVTVNNCQQTSVFTGSFTAADADFGGQGAGRTITTFAFVPCNQATVAGRATYDDYAQTPTGLSTTANPLPIRNATAEVHRQSDDTVLATGSTDQDGNFNLSFTNSGTPGYYVAIKAQQSNTTLNQVVQDQSGKVYSAKSSNYDETQIPQNVGITIAVTKAQSAAAFNIFDQGYAGAMKIEEVVGATPPKLTWVWQSGANAADCNTTSPISCYSRATDTIEVGSLGADPDDYDDLVQLHEYGHFFMAHYSGYNQVGGSHGLTGQYDPRISWNEGSATFFGNNVKGTPEYIDTNASGVGVDFSIQVPPVSSTATLGTSDNTQTGRLSEYLPGVILWSSEHSFGDEDDVFEVLTGMASIKATDSTARNPVGADLVDFLDGWFCSDNSSTAVAKAAVKAIVNTALKFPYDYAAPCN